MTRHSSGSFIPLQNVANDVVVAVAEVLWVIMALVVDSVVPDVVTDDASGVVVIDVVAVSMMWVVVVDDVAVVVLFVDGIVVVLFVDGIAVVVVTGVKVVVLTAVVLPMTGIAHRADVPPSYDRPANVACAGTCAGASIRWVFSQDAPVVPVERWVHPQTVIDPSAFIAAKVDLVECTAMYPLSVGAPLPPMSLSPHAVNDPSAFIAAKA